MEYGKQREDDPDELDWDLEALSTYLGYFVSVNDYDDLVVELSYEEEDE